MKSLHAIALAMVLVASISMNYSAWGKPHDFSILSHFPWWSWLLLVLAFAMLIISEIRTRPVRSTEKNNDRT